MDLLEWRARFQGDRVGYTFVADNGTDRISLNWQQLHRKAQLIGHELSAMGAAGKTVLLLYPRISITSPHFSDAWLIRKRRSR